MTTVTKNSARRRYGHWLLFACIGLILIGIEVVEHSPITPNRLDQDFVPEVLLLGVVFPLVGGASIDRLRRSIVRQESALKRIAAPCVLVIENELLGGLIKHMLSQEPNMHVYGATPRDTFALLDVIRSIRPNVVVLDDSVNLVYPSLLPDILTDFPQLRLVMVSAENEWAHIHDMKQVLITGKNEFAELVRGN